MSSDVLENMRQRWETYRECMEIIRWHQDSGNPEPIDAAIAEISRIASGLGIMLDKGYDEWWKRRGGDTEHGE